MKSTAELDYKLQRSVKDLIIDYNTIKNQNHSASDSVCVCGKTIMKLGCVMSAGASESTSADDASIDILFPLSIHMLNG